MTRATKRVERMLDEVVEAQQSVIAAQEKVRHEKAFLQDGQSHLAAFQGRAAEHSATHRRKGHSKELQQGVGFVRFGSARHLTPRPKSTQFGWKTFSTVCRESFHTVDRDRHCGGRPDDARGDAIQATQVAEDAPGSDTETAASLGGGDGSDDGGHSDVADSEHPILGEVAVGFEKVLASAVTRVAFSSLDAADLVDVFAKRARVLKSAFRSGLRVGAPKR